MNRFASFAVASVATVLAGTAVVTGAAATGMFDVGDGGDGARAEQPLAPADGQALLGVPAGSTDDDGTPDQGPGDFPSGDVRGGSLDDDGTPDQGHGDFPFDDDRFEDHGRHGHDNDDDDDDDDDHRGRDHEEDNHHNRHGGHDDDDDDD